MQLVIVGVGQPSVGRYVEDDHHFASENINDSHLIHYVSYSLRWLLWKKFTTYSPRSNDDQMVG